MMTTPHWLMLVSEQGPLKFLESGLNAVAVGQETQIGERGTGRGFGQLCTDFHDRGGASDSFAPSLGQVWSGFGEIRD